MLPVDRIDRVVGQTRDDIARHGNDVAYSFPMEDYLAYLRGVKSLQGGFRGNIIARQKGRRLLKEIKENCSRRALFLYNKLALFQLMRGAVDALDNDRFPHEILSLYNQWFERIVKDLSVQTEDYYDLTRIEFVQDIGVACLNSVPVGGAWVVQIGRVGLAPLVPGNPSQGLLYLGFLVLRAGGFKPFCLIHTVSRYLLRFNEKEMNLAYLRIAALMKKLPRIKGIYRRSWFLDPALAQISSNLAYLRQTPQQNGARLFPCATKNYDVKHAMAMSSAVE